MTEPTPVVSVVMSVFNGGEHLSRAIESITRQTYQDIEVIIIDDASTDSSLSVINGYAERDRRIRVLRNEKNIGLTRSLNRGLKACRGVFVARQDADDFSRSDRLEKQVIFLERHPNIMLLGTGGVFVEDGGVVLKSHPVATGSARIKKMLKKQNQFFHGSVMVRRACLDVVGFYHEEFRVAQDYDLFLRISERFDIDNINEPLYYYRFSYRAISFEKSKDQQRSAMVARLLAKKRMSLETVAWDTNDYQQITSKLNSFPYNRLIESNTNLARGEYCRVLGLNRDAKKYFLKAVLALPGPKRIYHFLRSLV